VRRLPSARLGASGRAGLLFTILVLLLGAAAAWWYFAPQSMPGWLARSVPASPKLGPPLYKWRDDKGRLHVTDKPPADRAYETVRYDPETNVVPGGATKP
jgi:uncharacterized protein DUF4124